jgi:hypothetical protein
MFAFRIDILVENKVIIELKSVERIESALQTNYNVFKTNNNTIRFCW